MFGLACTHCTCIGIGIGIGIGICVSISIGFFNVSPVDNSPEV
jgi:hypothetical protein